MHTMNGNDVGRPAHDERTADGRQAMFRPRLGRDRARVEPTNLWQ